MKTSLQIIEEQNKIISETENFFKLQDRWFADRTESNLDKIKIQRQKIKNMIADSKKPTQTLQ